MLAHGTRLAFVLFEPCNNFFGAGNRDGAILSSKRPWWSAFCCKAAFALGKKQRAWRALLTVGVARCQPSFGRETVEAPQFAGAPTSSLGLSGGRTARLHAWCRRGAASPRPRPAMVGRRARVTATFVLQGACGAESRSTGRRGRGSSCDSDRTCIAPADSPAQCAPCPRRLRRCRVGPSGEVSSGCLAWPSVAQRRRKSRPNGRRPRPASLDPRDPSPQLPELTAEPGFRLNQARLLHGLAPGQSQELEQQPYQRFQG